MAKKYNPDSPLMQFADTVADIIFLSVFWMVGCIPILTIGTSTTALYYATMKSIRREGSISKDFFKSYKENLKQSVLVELILLAAAALLYLSIKAAAGISVLYLLSAILLFLCVITAGYLFPLLSRFNQTVLALFRNALLIGFSNFPYTVAITVLNVLPVLVFIVWPTGFMRLLLIMLFAAPGLIARINSTLLMRVFAKYEDDTTANTDG